MPRPPLKRKKLNHPTTPSKRAPNQPALTLTPRAELQQKLADKPVGRVPSDSDDSDRLVTKNASGRNCRGIRRREIYASGGIAPGDVPASHPSEKLRQQNTRPADEEQGGLKSRQSGVDPARDQKLTNVDKPLPALPVSSPSRGALSVGKVPTRIQGTPAAETSVLASIKQRKRQPSILQQIQNDDSDIGPDDEDDFLPNDESTPFGLPKGRLATSSSLSSLSQPWSSRKRRLGPLEAPATSSQGPHPSAVSVGPLRSHHARSSHAEPELPPPQTPVQPSPTPAHMDDPGILAPPRSSSPSQGSRERGTQAPEKTTKGILKPHPVPTTRALQALLPARRKRRQLRGRNDFEIPADSDSASDDQVVSDNDDSAFGVRRKSRKAKPLTKPGGAKLKKKSANVGLKSTAGKRKGKTGTSTNSPLKPVTPLKQPPQPSKPSAANAKSSSFLSQRLRRLKGAVALNENEPAQQTGEAGVTYSSLRRQQARSEGDDGKENRREDLFDGSSSPRVLSKFDAQPSIEETGSTMDDVVDDLKAARKLERTRQKFREIDAFEMDFEDVTIDGSGQSSPNRR